MVPRRSTNSKNTAASLAATLFPNTAGATNANSVTPSVSINGALNDQIGQTLHGRLMDIKEQLNPLPHEQKGGSDQKYQSKFRRSGVVQSNG